nr:MAG TPA: tail tape measure protein [Caudoviricetes sp.]
MFGEAFSFIEEKSKNAYSTVQMSQNDYLRQVNGFATGLKTALGGNAQAAAELADRIITAEADVVAATGETQENVQNAFNGIMKSNFMMLDNLKLGITPTKEGFQEVIDKVNDWNKANGNATKYQIDNLADCQNALVDYIEMQGLANYAANEAASTIQGSLASTKAAWDNWLTGTGSVDALVGTVVNTGKLLAKTIGDLLPSLTTGISQLVAQLAPEIPPLINQLLPSIIDSIVTLIDSLGSQLPSILATILPVITQTAPQIVNTLITALISSLPVIVTAALQLLIALATGISQSLPTLIPTVVEITLTIVQTLIENLPLLVDAALQLITGLAQGLIVALPVLIAQAPTIISRLVQELIAAAPQLLLSAAEIVVQIVSGIADNLFALGKSAGEIITTIVEGIGEMWGSLVGVGSQVVAKIREGISNAWQGLKNWFKGLWDGLFGGLNVNVGVSGGGGKSAASGLDYVPRNNFPAMLHEGEAVLTASEAKAWRKGNGGAGNGVTINQYINAPAQTPVQLASATAAYFEQARWAI